MFVMSQNSGPLVHGSNLQACEITDASVTITAFAGIEQSSGCLEDAFSSLQCEKFLFL